MSCNYFVQKLFFLSVQVFGFQAIIFLSYPIAAYAADEQTLNEIKSASDLIGESAAQAANTTANLAITLQVVLLVLTAVTVAGGLYALKVLPEVAQKYSEKNSHKVEEAVESRIGMKISQVVADQILEVSTASKTAIALHGKAVGALNRQSMGKISTALSDITGGSQFDLKSSYSAIYAFTSVSEALSDLMGPSGVNEEALKTIDNQLTFIPPGILCYIIEFLEFLDASKFFKPRSMNAQTHLKVLIGSMQELAT